MRYRLKCLCLPAPASNPVCNASVCSRKVICAAGWLIVGELLTYFLQAKKYISKRRKKEKNAHSNRAEMWKKIRRRTMQTKSKIFNTQKASTVCLLFVSWSTSVQRIWWVSIRAPIKALTHSNSLKPFAHARQLNAICVAHTNYL